MGILVQNALITKQAFLLPGDSSTLSADMIKARHTPYSYDNVDDTTLGGNWVLNPPPQYTKFADIKERRRAVMPGSTGMGRGYSESINSFKEVVTLRFGKPRFTGASIFFTDFYDADVAVTVKTGRDPGILYYAAKAYTTVLSYLTPLPYLYMVGRIGRYFLGKPTSQYYYQVPTMHVYWASFQTLVNQTAINMGLIAGAGKDKGYVEEGGTVLHQYSIGGQNVEEFINYASKTLPGIYKKGGGVDIYQIATRRQRIQNAWVRRIQSMMENDYSSYEEFWNDLDKRLDSGAFPSDVTGRTLTQYLADVQKSKVYSVENKGDNKQTMDDLLFGRATYTNKDADANFNVSAATSDGGTSTQSQGTTANVGNSTSGTTQASTAASTAGGANVQSKGIGQTNAAEEAKFLDLMDAELADGAQFISFRVDSVTSVTETFSNSASESSIAQTMNSRAQANIERRFTLSGGNTGWAVLDEAIKAGSDLVNGAISGMGLDGIFGAFMGSGFADIPKFYSGSSVSLPRADLTMELRSWSGDRWSIFTNLMVPLLAILAGGLPQATGKSSYGMPFMCECYIPGKVQIKMGLIDNITVTRHVGNVPSTRERLPLGIDVSFSVYDLSSIVAMPITTTAASIAKLDPRGFLSDLLADDTPLNNYLAVLSALTLTEQVYMIPDLSRRMHKTMADIDSFWSKGNFASWLSDTMPGRIASGLLWKRTERPF